MKSRTLTCVRCGHQPAPEAFLAGLKVWWPWLDAGRHVCARCGFAEEVRPEPGRIVFGYLYAAATAHFADMEAAYIERLAVDRTPGGLAVTLGSTVVEVPAAVRP